MKKSSNDHSHDAWGWWGGANRAPAVILWNMRIVIAGASGLIGTDLTATLRSQGHSVMALVRREPSGPHEARWDPASLSLDPSILEGADAVINLSGAGIGDRLWTKKRVDVLVGSRLKATRTLTQAMAGLSTPPSVFLSQSASGYYGDTGSTIITEDHAAGTGFLADLCVEWEETAHLAPAGVRVVTPRTGIVLSPKGGALGKLLPLLRLGVGGPLGSGRQFWPWISLPDVSGALSFLLTADVEGPVNLAGPQSADVNTLTSALATALHRPAFLKVPGPILKLVMGKMAQEMLLSGQRMEPAVLTRSGYTFEHPTVDSAAAWVADSL